MYDRYVDDSNQIAETIPPLTKYNVLSERSEIDEMQNPDEEAEERTSQVLKEVADSVQPGIVMDIDHPSRNVESKLPILDMEVWLNGDGLAVYRHYEKPMANRQIGEEQ